MIQSRLPTGNRWLSTLEADDLGSGRVHVWRVHLDFERPVAPELVDLLSRSERERAARFAVAEDRHRFEVTRALLRALLARYVGREPERLVLADGSHGKPELAAEQNPLGLRFNVSHAGELALLAFALGRDVGVDVERIRQDVPVERLASRFFSGSEREALERLAPDRRRERFFTYWTRREAVAKASGEGLSVASGRLELSPDFEAAPSDSWIRVRGGSRYGVRDLDVASGYRAAVAVAGRGWTLRCADWTPTGAGAALPRLRLSYPCAMAWHAKRRPDAIAVLHEKATRTRVELERRANRLARVYQKLGVGEDDLVTLALPNGAEFLEACLAIWKLGATPQPVSSRLPERERRAIIELADPALVVGAPAGECGARPSLPAGFEPDASVPDEPLPDATSRHVRAMTSGGSTGRPKLILDLTSADCDPETPENGMQARGTTLVAGPLYHAGPFITAWQQLLCGGRVVVMTRFDAALALELIERHRVDWVLFVPTMMQRIWRLPEAQRKAYDLSSLRRVMCTGAPSPAWLKRAWIEWIGPDKLWEAYGGTERIAGTLISGTEWLEHPGSVGRPTAGRRIRVLRADGSTCDPGEVGEIFMMPAGGRGTTYRYVGAEPTTTADGWETLGDLGYLDAEGWLYLVDRKSDMIVTGGANVYPAEVEAALDAHPSVRSSAVIGLPDDDLGQRIHAIVDAPAGVTPDELRGHVEQHLVGYKIPRSFEFVKEPLRDDAGKVRRSALRDARLGRV